MKAPRQFRLGEREPSQRRFPSFGFNKKGKSGGGRGSGKCSLNWWILRACAVFASFLLVKTFLGEDQVTFHPQKMQQRVVRRRRSTAKTTEAPKEEGGWWFGSPGTEAPKGPVITWKKSPFAKKFLPHLRKKKTRGGPQCYVKATAAPQWRQVQESDLALMNSFGDRPAAARCTDYEGVLVFDLDLKKATKAHGLSYDLPFPDNIVADEPLHPRRSTLQLFLQTASGGIGKPLGPAHSKHKAIAENGDGAFSHWRHAITSGPYTQSSIRFSLPGNVALNQVKGLIAIVHPMAPPMGWIEFAAGQKKNHEELFRELFFLTFPSIGVEPHVIERPEDTRNGTWYLWRVGGNHEFELPLQNGELYEKRLPYQIAEWYSQFEKKGGVLFPPPESYKYYQNKVGLARLFDERGVKTPKTWIFESLDEALRAQAFVTFPVVIKDPYGYSSLGIQQAGSWEEFERSIRVFFQNALPGVEAIVQSKVVALREARVTYVDGVPFHGYWRIRQSLKSATAASNYGGYQDFSFPLEQIAPFVADFAKKTGVPVGGVDLIWREESVDVRNFEPFTLEVSPTSDINPPAPASWKSTYADFKHTSNYHEMYLGVRRRWAEQMAMAVVERYRRTKRHLFVDIDNVVALSAPRVLRNRGGKEAYSASEVMKDDAVPDAAEALSGLRKDYFIRFLTARGQYEDAFNVTQTWLDLHGFQYDELLVVKDAASKTAHMWSNSLLVDDFTVGHETESPSKNEKFMSELRDAGLPFVVFPLGGLWADILPELRAKGSSLLRET